ncbi:hypothetical protein M5K25_016339 [Dendrobium thyrsiflorum]|uniref:RNase H type-1 domain-containing protein n=1 Tax=Dendrobium thyrsiflorum TaxID=117978 RepID=A0ABD0UJI4_DENTH
MVDKFIANSGWKRAEISNITGTDLVDLVCQTRLNPRVEVFWWRLFNTIPTFHFFSYRRLHYEDGCLRRCNEREDLEHVAVKCKKLLEVFDHLSKWGFIIPAVPSFGVRDKESFYRQSTLQRGFLFLESRNKLIHNGIEDSSLVIAVNAISFISFLAYGIDRNSGIWGINQSHRLLNLTWYPPPSDWIKVNVDATLLPSYKAGIGGIFRDYKGRLLLAFGKTCVHWDVGSLELSTTLYIKEVLKDWMFKYKGIVIEGDNANIIKFLQEANSATNANLDDSYSFRDFNHIIFNCIYRSCNKLADLCAYYALFNSFIWEEFRENKIPPYFMSLLKEESSSYG